MKLEKRSSALIGLSLLLVLCITFSCETKKPEESSDASIDTLATLVDNGEQEEDYVFTGEKLLSYKDFVDHLDPFQVENIQVATEKFKTVFKGVDSNTCDSAYYIFERYYSLTEDHINETHSNDTTNFEPLLEGFVPLDGSSEAGKPLSAKLKDYVLKLNTNGFAIASTEGMTYIQKDRNYVKKNFYSMLTPVMVEYLEQMNKENQEGYWEDGGLIISSTQLVDRIVWWEFFTKRNPHFIFKNIPNQKQQLYITSLVRGEDNTRLYDDEEKIELSQYYKEAYDYLFTKQSNSQAASDLKPYYDALIRKDTAEINKFRRAL